MRTMETTVERRNIGIPKPHIEELEDIAQKTDVKLPQLVRDAIKDYLDKLRNEHSKP